MPTETKPGALRAAIRVEPPRFSQDSRWSDDPLSSSTRLTAVRNVALLDTDAEPAFDDLTRLAALITGAPLAFATIVDEARCFWKSTFGIEPGALRQNPVEQSFCRYVVRTGREFVVTNVDEDERTRTESANGSTGVRAWAGFPLVASNGEILGAFCAVDSEPRPWSERDVEVLRTLAHAASREIAMREIANIARTAREQAEETARILQEALAPPILPAIDNLDVAAVFHAAGTGMELGGDFYDVLRSGENRWNFVVGDVCGKGVAAAKIATLARYAVSAAAAVESSPAAVLSWLNETLLQRSPHPDIFLTAAYGTISRHDAGAVVRIASAGHVPPLLKRANGQVEVVEMNGIVVGITTDFHVEEKELALQPGDALVIYTDGVDEARSPGGIWGSEAVQALLGSFDSNVPAQTIATQIADAALEFSGGAAADDIAVFVIRIPYDV